MSNRLRIFSRANNLNSNSFKKRDRRWPVEWVDGAYISLKPIVEFSVVMITFPLWGSMVFALWLLVKLSEPAIPAFFCQQRTGLRGKRFTLYKLRTMVSSAAAMQARFSAYNLTTDSPNDFKMANDPRVTKLGRVLRSSHLDELPQLVNVLLGDMSIVGPRPSTIPASEYKTTWLPRLTVRPGLTGLAQINRAECHDFGARAQLDIEYIRNQSLWLDIWIVWRTAIVALIERKGI